jgi:hypothetical protein
MTVMDTNSNIARACVSLRRLLFAVMLSPAMTRMACASEHGAAPAADGHGASAAAVDPKLPRTFNLGDFDIHNFRPTHNEIANIHFSLHVVLAPGTSEAVLAELENWKRRLRDQAITAVRSAEPEDLAEPKLVRVQKIILLRIKRLPLPLKEPVVGLYLTDFAVSSG